MFRYLIAIVNGDLLEACYDIVLTVFINERKAIEENRNFLNFNKVEDL
jgi:hypothetical protein